MKLTSFGFSILTVENCIVTASVDGPRRRAVRAIVGKMPFKSSE
jgi:hypothetical protein